LPPLREITKPKAAALNEKLPERRYTVRKIKNAKKRA
jgi:hypothetical protein